MAGAVVVWVKFIGCCMLGVITLRFAEPIGASGVSGGSGQVILVRHDQHADAIDIVLISACFGKAANRIDQFYRDEAYAKVASSRRRLLLGASLSIVDLDAVVEANRKSPLMPGDPDSEKVRAVMDYEKNISLVESKVLLDPAQNEWIGLLQRVRVERASAGLRLLDNLWNAILVEDLEKPSGATTRHADTLAMQLSHAKSAGSWMRFAGRELEVTLPMTPECAADQLRSWMGSGLPPAVQMEGGALPYAADRHIAQMLTSLTSIQIASGAMKMRFAPTEDAWIMFRLCDCADAEAGAPCRGESPVIRAEISRLKRVLPGSQ